MRERENQPGKGNGNGHFKDRVERFLRPTIGYSAVEIARALGKRTTHVRDALGALEAEAKAVRIGAGRHATWIMGPFAAGCRLRKKK